MRISILIGVCLLSSNLLAAEVQPAAATCEMVVDFSKSAGKIRPLNGVNNGPFVDGNHTADMNARHKEAAFSSVRLHDCHWPNPNVVDIPSIFPLFHADADDPKNYVFGPTDNYLAPIAERGAEIVYRLGVSIEHKTRYHTQPPADYEKWAKICVNIIRHYNDGWANGKRWGIKYFEIWNEPDIGGAMWQGTLQQYLDLYRVSVTAIKAYNPALKVSGQVCSCGGQYAKSLLAYCRDQKLPMDFFSWHCYSNSPGGLSGEARQARSLLDANGFTNAASMCTEWRPMLAGFGEVAWSPNKPAGSVRAAFDRNRNHEAAAFAASALMQAQDAPLDMAHYYTADDSPWSMFDEYGEPGKVFYAFKAFNMFLQTSNRVAVAGAPGGNGVTACCGMADDGKSAGLLLSNYRGKPADMQIALKDFPLGENVKMERFIVDQTHDCAPLDSLSIVGTSRTLRLSLPPATVMLVRLSLLNSGLLVADPVDKDISKNSKGNVITIGNAELAFVLGGNPSPAEKRVTELFAERIKDRAGVELAAPGDQATFRLVIGKVASNDQIKTFSAAHKEVAALGADGYVIAIDPGSKEIHVAGQSDSGVVAGVGRLMREMRYKNRRVEVPSLHIAETPQMPNRGMYLWARKEFFGKPDQVDRYVEEFALWGCNGIGLWFEMGMFKSFDDPEAKSWLDIYRRLYATAKRMGMKTGLLMVMNDAYNTSPTEMRIKPIIGCPDHYLCPNKPGSVEQMIAWQEQVFKALPQIDIFNLFPADPGGCSCPDCTPWPTRGFWRIAKPLANRIHEISPKTEIWVDTWHVNHPTFGGKDWQNLVASLDWTKERPKWFAGFEVGLAPHHGFARMSAEDREVYNEAKQPLMVFPDISMWGNHPGMLVNKEYWKSLQTEMNDYSPELMKGGWPYSERWNTDIASVMMLSWFWNPKKSVETVMDEYASFYFGPEAASGRDLLDLLDDSNKDPQRKEKISEKLAKLEGSLPEWVKRDWRWAEILESCRFGTR